MFPGQDVAFRQVPESELPQHVEQLSTVMHAVRDDVGDGTAIGLLARRFVQDVQPTIIPGLTIGNGRGDVRQPLRGDIEPTSEVFHRFLMVQRC